MPWQMPSPPPGLVELLKRGGQVPPTGAPGQPTAQAAPMAPSGQDAIRAAVAPAPVQPAQTPPPASDDPAVNPISKLPPVPTPPDMSNSPVTALQQRVQGIQNQEAAIPKPDPTKLHPKLWERLAGAATGFAAGWGNAERGVEIGSNVTNRRWNGAQADYERQLGPLEKQRLSELQNAPLAEAAAKIPQTNYENSMSAHREARETSTGEARTRDLQSKADLADQRAQNLQDKLDHPKRTEPKNADEALSAASAATDPTEKTRLIKLANDLHKQEIDRVKSARDPKQNPEDKPATPGQKAGVEAKKAAALDKAHSDYARATRDLPKDPNQAWTDEQKGTLQQAKDDFDDAQQAAENAYESEVAAQGGKAEHQDVTKGTWRGKPNPTPAPQGSPAAQPQAGGITVSKANLQKAATAHFGGDYGKAKAQFLKDNPTGKVQE